MDTYSDKPKRTVEQVNFWFSKYNQAWMSCAWIVKSRDTYTGKKTYEQERVPHVSLTEAAKYVAQNYVGVQS